MKSLYLCYIYSHVRHINLPWWILLQIPIFPYCHNFQHYTKMLQLLALCQPCCNLSYSSKSVKHFGCMDSMLELQTRRKGVTTSSKELIDQARDKYHNVGIGIVNVHTCILVQIQTCKYIHVYIHTCMIIDEHMQFVNTHACILYSACTLQSSLILILYKIICGHSHISIETSIVVILNIPILSKCNVFK